MESALKPYRQHTVHVKIQRSRKQITFANPQVAQDDAFSTKNEETLSFQHERRKGIRLRTASLKGKSDGIG